VFKKRTKESNYVVWQKQINQGSRTETLTLPSLSGTVNTPFKAPGGITVQIPEGDFRSQIATLSAQPGMGYLDELTQRNDVNGQRVKLAHDQWNFQQEGLTPAGAALLSVAVAWAKGGMGANLLGTTGGATSTMSELTKSGQFADKLTYNLINATGRALTTTAINGGDLQGALKSAIVGGLVDTAQGQAASLIGQSNADYLSHKLAHALVGCVAGAAAGGACKDGAIGGAVGEIVAESFKGQVPSWNLKLQ
jgi:hypothetical protein